MGVDRTRVHAAVRELLAAIGCDPDAPELQETPSRVADAYAEMFAGVGSDPAQHLTDLMPAGEGAGEAVIVRGIELRSVCEHHLLPFRGTCHIAYLPREKVAGLGALPRVVDTLAARPQIQERLGEQIAEAVERGLDARGVLVVLEARHGCVSDRGVKQASATAVTVASRGELSERITRAEIMSLIGGTGC